eukprot:UN00834
MFFYFLFLFFCIFAFSVFVISTFFFVLILFFLSWLSPFLFLPLFLLFGLPLDIVAPILSFEYFAFHFFQYQNNHQIVLTFSVF